MKLNDIRPNIETSGQLEEQFFSIKDQGMIFDILRNKMYSNPILAICREISCNARDAHREVGIPHTPIHIHLPSNLEQFYKIKDFGPGISPDRMANVFIQYTASTKRSDNVQTGGFGLGAKTPFSYSDTFTIKTNVDGTQYNYACFIDETKVGKLALLSESPTKEPNGTEIIIPVKPVDFRFFADYTEQATRHWDVKPIIKGSNIVWKDQKNILEGTNWAIAATNEYQRNCKLVIDGIEYPLEQEALRKYADPKLIEAAKGNLYLYFGVGELSLSASREQVYLDKNTQQKIRERLSEVISEIKTKVETKINSFSNLWDANIYYRKDLNLAFSRLEFLGQLKWNNIPLSDPRASLNCPLFYFKKGKYSRKNGMDPDKLTRSLMHSLAFEEGSALFINDLPIKEPTPRHVKKAFEDNPKLTSVQVVCFNDKVTQEFLNRTFHLDKMAPRCLSSITKASARNYTQATSRLLVFKFDPIACAFRQVSYASIDDDPNRKILSYLTHDHGMSNLPRQTILKNKKHISLASIKSLCDKFPKCSFYGVDVETPAERVKEDFSDFGDIETFINKEVLSDGGFNYIEIKFATKHAYKVDERLLTIYTQLKNLVNDPESPFLKRLDLHKRMKKIASGDTGLLFLYESINGEIKDSQLAEFVKVNPDSDLELINKNYETRYPLLKFTNSYNYGQIVQPIAQYVNLIDKV
jgi:hypothetical protein